MKKSPDDKITVLVIIFWFSWYLSVSMCIVIFCK